MKATPGTRAASTSRRLLVLLFIVAIPLAGFAQTAAQSHKAPTLIRIGMVKDTAAFKDGGCSLQLPADAKKQNERYVFMSDLDDNAVMNLDGRDTKLKPVSHREPKGDPRKGDRSTWSYAARGTSVRVDFVVTKACGPNDEGCEAWSNDATITVIRGPDKQVVEAKGMCGT
jgi:hypothetical protein